MKYSFVFDFCTDNPYGDEVIGFEVNLLLENARGDTWTELLFKGTAYLDERWNPITLVRVRENAGGRLFILNRKFRVTASGAGGNYHWQAYRVQKKEWPRMVNLLRGLPVDRDEWDGRFMEKIWRKRGTVQPGDLREFVLDFLKAEKAFNEALRSAGQNPSPFVPAGFKITL